MSLKILSIGSDRKLFEVGSAVSERIKDYGTLVNELHIIVFAKWSLGLKNRQLSDNVWIYPTNSFSRWFYISDAVRLGKKIVFDKKFVRGQSLITTQDPFESGLVGLKIKKRWRLPLEVQLHTDPFSPDFRSALNIVRKVIARKVLRRADNVRVVTEYLKTKIKDLTDAHINVLPIYVDYERIENAVASFDLHERFGWNFILLTVSRLSAEKKLSTALRALALVRHQYKDIGLVIVGSGPEERRLKRLARRLKLKGAVTFVGWQDDLTSFYKTANIFIQTSTFEGYGMSLVEAGLSGLPVITTPVGIARELENNQNAYICPPNRPELFALGILDLMENNHKREGLRINLKHFLKSKLVSKKEYLEKLKFNWADTASKVI